MKILIGILVAALLAGCTSAAALRSDAELGPSAPPTSKSTSSVNSPKPISAPGTPTGAVGDPLLVLTSDYHLNITLSDLKRAKVSEYASPTGVVYSVLVEATTTAGIWDANPLYFTARSAAGDTYDADVISVDGDLHATDVTVGQNIRGLVAFDVPKGQTISLIIMAEPFGGQLAIWKV